MQDKLWIIIFHLTKAVIPKQLESKSCCQELFTCTASCSSGPCSSTEWAPPQTPAKPQMGQLQNPSHSECYKARGSFLQQSTKTTNQQIFLFKGAHLAWTALPGISSRISGFLYQWFSTYKCLTTTEIRAVKQNIPSHCWHLCPSNSSRHSLDVLGLEINSALPVSPQKSWALGPGWGEEPSKLQTRLRIDAVATLSTTSHKQ